MSSPVSDQFQKLKRNRLLMILMVLSFIVVLIWTALALFSSQTQSKLPNNILQLTSPLNPAIDHTMIQQIEDKRGLTESELANFPIYKIITDQESRVEKIVTIDTSEADLQLDGPRPTPPNLNPAGVDESEPFTPPHRLEEGTAPPDQVIPPPSEFDQVVPTTE